ncbi:uncharacterized protein LOC123397458 [Hordeum vulgare subsp. vulgare]|uniref:uncharacterized protein LOC123397458 n=1 Tax=Hordeum vulgare subsp. vulgare TaxID=112509 RepID=UPI001D1A46D7|nr:uncharacterized protein LOC123397458 [Hordeum vulgare subsp. vulgare]
MPANRAGGGPSNPATGGAHEADDGRETTTAGRRPEATCVQIGVGVRRRLTELPASAQNGRPGSEPAAAPEVEVQLVRRGRGPVAVFRSPLCGYTQDQLEVGDILERHGLKSVFAFDAASRARGVAIHSTPRNGRSLLPYVADSTIFLDGEPKVSLHTYFVWGVLRVGD